MKATNVFSLYKTIDSSYSLSFDDLSAAAALFDWRTFVDGLLNLVEREARV